MEQEKIDYILRYSSNLMPKEERIAWRHYSTMYKHEFDLDEESTRYNMYIKRGWISQDPEVLKLLDSGIDSFREKTAERILQENKTINLFDYCPDCKGLLRTPKAQQCRHCFHDWHKVANNEEVPWIIRFYKSLLGRIARLFK